MDVLIIEDNTITRVVFKKLVETLGYAVTVCNTAEAALDICQEQFFPIVLLDLGLPGIDGFEFCRRLRALPRRRHSQVLVVSAYDSPQDVRDALEAGADDYIVKPVGAELLHMRLTIMERRANKLLGYDQPECRAILTQDLPLEQALVCFEQYYLSAILARHQWHVPDAAAALGLAEPALSEKIGHYGLAPPRN